MPRIAVPSPIIRGMRLFKPARLLAVAAAALLTFGATGVDTIPRPPKFDYTMTKLPNGLQVVFLEALCNGETLVTFFAFKIVVSHLCAPC